MRILEKNKNLILIIITAAVFCYGFFITVRVVNAGSEDVVITDSDGDGILLYRLTHPDYAIGQRGTAGGGSGHYNFNDTKVIFHQSWSKDEIGIPVDDPKYDFCASGSSGCQAYCWGNIEELKQWYRNWKNDIGSVDSLAAYNNICHKIPQTIRFFPNFGIVWSRIPGEEGVIYGVHTYNGWLKKFDTENPNQQWEDVIELIPDGASTGDAGYNPYVFGIASDGRVMVSLVGQGASARKFGIKGVEGYIVDPNIPLATEILSLWGGRDTWHCLNNPYTSPQYNYVFSTMFGADWGGHVDMRIIDGKMWGSDHGYQMAMSDQSPDYSGDCEWFIPPKRPKYGSYNYVGSGSSTSTQPSHLDYADDDWFITDSCEWSPKKTDYPRMMQCYILQRYFDTKTRTWGEDIEPIEWSNAGIWTRRYDKSYDISMGTPQSCIVDYDVNGDGKVDNSDNDKYCQGNIKNDPYSYQAECDEGTDKCVKTISNYFYFTGPNLSPKRSSLGFTSGDYGKFSEIDYENYGQYQNPPWNRDIWDRTGFWHSEIIIGASTDPADVNRDGQINIKDIQAVIKEITGSGWTCYNEPCSADVNGDGSVNIKDIQAIIKVIIG